MQSINELTTFQQPSQNLVNYTILPTQASNELYIAGTDVPDSTAFLIRNNIIIDLSMPNLADEIKE